MSRLFGAVALCLVLVADANAGWGPAGCLPVGRPVAPVAAPAYRWQPGVDPVQVHLFYGSRQIGTYRHDDGRYYPFDGQSWGPAAVCPTDLPTGAVKRACSCSSCGPKCPCERDGECRQALPSDVIAQNFGVDLSKLSGDPSPRYYLGDRKVERDQVVEAITAPRLPDDSRKGRITVIGSPEATKGVLATLKGIPEAAEYVIKEYQPTDWAVRPGFVTTGNPTIYVQAADGRVLHRQDDPQGLAEALRKARPDYKSENDPDLRKLIPSLPFKLPNLDSKTVLLLVLAGVGAYLYFRKSK